MKVKQEYERMPANEVWNIIVAYINTVSYTHLTLPTILLV